MIETKPVIASPITTGAADSGRAPARRNFAKPDNIIEKRTAGTQHALQLRGSSQSAILHTLEKAATGNNNFEYVLGYAVQEQTVITPATQNEGYNFYDVLDVVNPLQHLPLVSTLYRGITGDELKAAPRIIGGAIFGGPVGAISSTLNVVVEEETGKDITGNAVALVLGDVAQSPDLSFHTVSDSSEKNQVITPATPDKNMAAKAASAYQARYNS